MLRKADYRKVYSAGRRRNLDIVVAFAMRNGKPQSRVGITVPGSLGGAVERNRVKRRLREIARKHLEELENGWDIVLNARPAILSARFAPIEETLQEFFQACARFPRSP
ncbi:MAG: ribonuclease P protein component [Acidobacteria bacterium]|nr:ribonuclease P protein component [Acidobacteriota bacterium]